MRDEGSASSSTFLKLSSILMTLLVMILLLSCFDFSVSFDIPNSLDNSSTCLLNPFLADSIVSSGEGPIMGFPLLSS